MIQRYFIIILQWTFTHTDKRECPTHTHTHTHLIWECVTIWQRRVQAPSLPLSSLLSSISHSSLVPYIPPPGQVQGKGSGEGERVEGWRKWKVWREVQQQLSANEVPGSHYKPLLTDIARGCPALYVRLCVFVRGLASACVCVSELACAWVD